MHSSITRSAVVSVAALVITVAALAAADVITDIGMTPASAKEQVMSGFNSGWLSYSMAAPAFKKAPPAVRAQLAEGVVAWARAYTASPEYKTAYATLRERRKPRAPEFTGTPEEEAIREREKRAKDQARSTEEMKKAMEKMAPEQRKQMEAALEQTAAVMKQMDTPEMRKMMVDGIRMQREGSARQYQEDLKKWGAEYPENPSTLMAKRLKAFLDMSATVDFQAKVETKNGKARFVNPEYEDKPSEWKLCYRVGPETVAAARAAAQAWLKELGS